jgi:ferritin-like metal-binding protein YciE
MRPARHSEGLKPCGPLCFGLEPPARRIAALRRALILRASRKSFPDRLGGGRAIAWNFFDADMLCGLHPHRENRDMAEKKLNDLFYDTLKDIYFAERQILKALPKMAKAAKSEELKSAFLTHRDETETHVERLTQVFDLIGKRAQAKTCEAIKGILEEGDEIAEDYAGSEALDAGLLAGGQSVEHYEMARYGTLKTWALQLGMKDAANLLEQTLQEEKKTDALLSKLAQAKVNLKAA